VIGAGIAGLSAAYDLQRAGFEVTVLEKDDAVGGRIKSIKRDGFVFDVGAFIYLGSYQDSVNLIKELGLGRQLGRFDAYGAMPRDGVLNFLDFSKPIRTILGTGYLTFGSKLKLIKLLAFLFRHWKDLNYHDATGIAAIDDDTVKTYCDREMNAEIYDYVASVVVRGPWLADPSDTSIGQLLWTMKNFFKPYFYGLDDGMDALPRALAARLNVNLNCAVSNVTDLESGVAVTCAKDGTLASDRFDGCIIATPVDAALAMYPQMDAAQRGFYSSTTYISAVDTHLVLRRRPSNPATYIMVSPRENPHLCGVIVDHLKAANRVPDGMGMLTVFCSDEWSKANMNASDESVLSDVLGFIEPYYGDLRSEVVDYEIGRWPVVVPKMKQGRFRQIALYEKSIDAASRVQLAGDLDPIGGVNAALVSGKQAAARIMSQHR
jgi:protoporphyrinogen/coproporphyrinogen III oxidase